MVMPGLGSIAITMETVDAVRVNFYKEAWAWRAFRSLSHLA